MAPPRPIVKSLDLPPHPTTIPRETIIAATVQHVRRNPVAPRSNRAVTWVVWIDQGRTREASPTPPSPAREPGARRT
jgi:hypothetical protein